jgi:hypothetical protein
VYQTYNGVAVWMFGAWFMGGFVLMACVAVAIRRVSLERLWEAVRRAPYVPQSGSLLDAIDALVDFYAADRAMLKSKEEAIKTLTGQAAAASEFGKVEGARAKGLELDLETATAQRNELADDARELYLKLAAAEGRLAKFDRPRDAKGRIISAKAAAKKRGK